jgi:hypothetical protein
MFIRACIARIHRAAGTTSASTGRRHGVFSNLHKSKLAGFIIDCNTSDLSAAARFWGGALGMEIQQLPGTEGDKYVKLVDPGEQLHIEVQSVSHPSRVHLDIETDDIDAEVRPQSAEFAERANDW